MSVFSWIERLRGDLRPASRAPATRRRKRVDLSGFYHHPRVEVLEDRHLLAVLTVNSLVDNVIAGDGVVTLREAIIAANADTATDTGEEGNGAEREC